MAVRDDLEAELADRLDDTTLAIYADHLQQLGDPRGELIALDLAGVASTDTRRAQILESWLGPDHDFWCDEAWYVGDETHTWATFDRGFMEITVTCDAGWPPSDALAALLAGPAGPYVSRLFVSGDHVLLRAAIVELASKPRPWLRDLAIRDDHRVEDLARPGEPMVDAALHAALCAATPRLERLDVAGRRVFHALAHPAIRELSILGEEAIGLPDGPAMPRVTAIDFAFDPDQRFRPGTLERLIAPTRFPAVRHLRLARNEPGSRNLFPLLGELRVAPQLTQLQLPSLRSRDDLLGVQAAIDRMPSLHVVEIARAYHISGGIERELAHSSARIRLPVVWTWPPLDMIEGGRVLWIHTHGIIVETLVELMDAQYMTLPQVARDAWDRFWHLVSNLGWTRTPGHEIEELPAHLMLAALADVVTDDPRVAALRDDVARVIETDANSPIRIRWR